jgi:hypothetical protein
VSTGDALTLAVAIYGAVLSTAVGIATWIKDYRVRLRIFHARFFDERPADHPAVRTGAARHVDGLAIRAVNVGHRPVTLHGYAFVTRDGNRYVPGDYQPAYETERRFGHKPEAGDQAVLYIAEVLTRRRLRGRRAAGHGQPDVQVRLRGQAPGIAGPARRPRT